MSPVIKSSDMGGADRVRPLMLRVTEAETAVSTIDPEIIRLRAELQEASARIEARDAEIDRLKIEIETVRVEAERSGYDMGLVAATDRQADRVALLEAGVADAITQLKSEFSALERLAPALAREALGRLIGSPQHRGDLVTASVLHAVRQIDADAIVRVDVAVDDFPETESLSEELFAVAHRRVETRYSPDLEAGECRIRLVLGDLEVGLDQQWNRLALVFDEMSAPEAAS